MPEVFQHLAQFLYSAWTVSFKLFSDKQLFTASYATLSPVLTCLSLLHGDTESLRNIDRNLGLKCF